MVVASRMRPAPSAVPSHRSVGIGKKIAALAGAAGAVAAGTDAHAVPLTPTAGVTAGSGASAALGRTGIPGFVFVSDTNVTLGALAPVAAGSVEWDVDGDGSGDFRIENRYVAASTFSAVITPLAPFSNNPNGIVFTGTEPAVFVNIATGGVVGGTAYSGFQGITPLVTATGVSPYFPDGTAGQFGFRFGFSNDAGDYYYGWAEMTVQPRNGSGNGGYTISQAYYSSSPIAVGAVPVPEPASIALLAIGSAGVAAWRMRKKKQQA